MRSSGIPTPRQGPLIGALNTPTRGSSSTTTAYPSPRGYVEPTPMPTQHTPQKDQRRAILNSLARCLAGARYMWFARAIAVWRLSLSHIQRHQALLRLQAQSQSQ